MLLRSLVVSAILLSLGYVFVDAFVANSDMILGMRVLSMAVAIVVMVCWGPEFANAISSSVVRPGHLSSCALFFTAGWFAVESAYLVIFRLAGQPKWFANSDLTAGILMFKVAAFAMFIMDPSPTTLQVPTRARLATGIAISLATVALLLLIGTRPDLGPTLEHIRPYITDWFDTGLIGIGSAHAS